MLHLDLPVHPGLLVHPDNPPSVVSLLRSRMVGEIHLLRVQIRMLATYPPPHQ
nr:hypothetical protein Q903MT_gene390 [Picea sitchensis]